MSNRQDRQLEKKNKFSNLLGSSDDYDGGDDNDRSDGLEMMTGNVWRDIWDQP